MLVSVNADDLAAVVALACLTESRSNADQRSLLKVAERVDEAMNSHAGTNPRWRDFLAGETAEWTETHYEADVAATRDFDAGNGDRHVRPSWERDPDRSAKARRVRAREVAEIYAARGVTRGDANPTPPLRSV